jgi:hypothetical protein
MGYSYAETVIITGCVLFKNEIKQKVSVFLQGTLVTPRALAYLYPGDSVLVFSQRTHRNLSHFSHFLQIRPSVASSSSRIFVLFYETDSLNKLAPYIMTLSSITGQFSSAFHPFYLMLEQIREKVLITY